MFRSSLILLSLLAATSCSDSTHNNLNPGEVVTAAKVVDLEVDLSRKNFIDWFSIAYPSHTELRWRTLGWQLDSKSGFDLAKQSRKPLLLWLEDGHPMGATSQRGRDMRSTLGDDSLVSILNEYTLAAVDINRAPDFIDVNSGQLAIYLPSGEVFASSSDVAVELVANFLTSKLADYKSLSSEQLSNAIAGDAFSSAIRTEDDFPDNGLALEVFKRHANSFVLDEYKQTPWLKDFIWFNKTELLSFVTPIKISSKIKLSADLMNRIVHNGFSSKFAANDMVKAEVVFSCNSIKQLRSTYIITGIANYQQGDEMLQVKLRGKATYDSGRDQFGLLEIIALGKVTNADGSSEQFTTALRKVTSIDNWHRVPPKNLSDYADNYYLSNGSGKPNK